MVDTIFPNNLNLADMKANLNTFSTNPPTSQGEGEIIYNSTDDEVYKNTGTVGTPVWETIGGGLENIVEDTTPQLGGDLDCNGKKLTGVTYIQTAGTIIFQQV